MLNNMLGLLEDYLPAPIPDQPPPSVSVVSVTEQSVGLGNRVGTETRGSFAVSAVKGKRLDAVVRFQVWGNTPDETNTLIRNLQESLLNDKEALMAAGFLRFTTIETSISDFNPAAGSWTQTTDCKVLYEFRLLDTDGAESLIARIPININSQYQESTVETDKMLRWDNLLAPTLVLRGRLQIKRLCALAFIPGQIPSGSITLLRTFDGAVGEPTTYATLTAFLAAISGSNPTNRHGQIVFSSLGTFISAFSINGDSVTMGDWNSDGVPDIYESRELNFKPTIQLTNATERLEIIFENNAFNQVAVVYVQAS